MTWTTKPEWPVDLTRGNYLNKADYDKAVKEFDRACARIIKKVYSNLKPTHDPYTNPNSHIYYECNCGAILDPGTQSFAQLNNVAMNTGWKVRWGERGYTPYCVECGKDVE